MKLVYKKSNALQTEARLFENTKGWWKNVSFEMVSMDEYCHRYQTGYFISVTERVIEKKKKSVENLMEQVMLNNVVC